MYELFFIARNNLKKKKGDVAILFFLMLLSSLILYVSISVLTNMDHVLEQSHENFHGADFLYIVPEIEAAKVTEIIYENEDVAESQTADVWIPTGGVSYRKSKDAEKKAFSFIFETIEDEKTIGKLSDNIVLDSDEKTILLPYYLKISNDYAVGEKIYLTIGEQEYEFKIGGFVEDPMFANPTNISFYYCYLERDTIQQIIDEQPLMAAGHCLNYQVRLKAGADSLDFDDQISVQLTKEIPELGNAQTLGMNWTSMKGGAGIAAKIAMGIMLVFSILLMMIALIIVRFSVRNFLERNMKNIGVLEATGYTTRQLQASAMLEMVSLAVVASITGVILGIAGSSLIGNIQASIIGISWNQKPDITAAFISIIVVVALVMGITWMVGRIYKKITVLSALRGGIMTHNFRKNYLPFEKSILPVSWTLGIKAILQEKIKNVMVMAIIALLSFSSCVGFFIYENFSKDMSMLMKMSGIEVGTAWINGEDLAGAGEQIKGLPSIEQVLFFDINTVRLSHDEKSASVTCDMWDEPEKLINEMVVAGRLPRQDNEIVLTTATSEQLGVAVGDVIYVEGSGERLDYIVVGIDQKINEMGRKALMNLAGGTRLNGREQVTSLYLYATEGTSFEQIKKEVTSILPDLQLTDGEKQTEDSMGSATAGMKAICVIFVTITIGVVIMIVMLLIKNRLAKERKNYGIQKALGFTTPQLVIQTILTNLPVDLFGAVIGAILAKFLMNPLVALSFSFCGIQKCDLQTPAFWLVLDVVGIMIIAMLTAILSASKIHKIEPVMLLQEDC